MRQSLLLPSHLIADSKPALWLDAKRRVGENRLLNGGFETAGTGGQPFANWTKDVAGTSTVTDDTVEMDSGAHCCKLTIDGSNSLAGLYQSACVVGKTYTIRWRAKASAACTMRVVGYGSAVTISTSYQTFSVTFVATGAFVELSRTSAANQSIYIDNVSMCEVPEFATDAAGAMHWLSRKPGSPQFVQTTNAAIPTFDAVDQNNLPCLVLDGGDYLKRSAASLAGNTGRVLIVAKTGSTNTEQVLYSQADEATADQYLKLGISSGNKIWYKFDNGAGVTAVELAGDTVLSTGWHVLEWVSDGSAIAMYVDGDPQTITTVGGTDAGYWFGDVTGTDNSVVGAAQTTSVSGYLTGSIAELVAYEPDKSAGLMDRVRQRLANNYALTLASVFLLVSGGGLALNGGGRLLLN